MLAFTPIKDLKILFVGDDQKISDELQNLLDKFGCRSFETVKKARDASDIVERRRPDLVLMNDDRQRDESAEPELGSLIENREIPVIFIISDKDASSLDTSKLKIPFGYVRRPLDERELKIAVEMTLYHNNMEVVKNNDKAHLSAALELLRMTERTINEIIDFALEQACVITKSKMGFINSVEENETMTTQISWSRFVMESCRIVDKPIRFNVAKGGVWKEAIIQRRPIIINDYNASQYPKLGTPAGHAPLNRIMLIPVFDKNEIVMLTAVANRDTDYTEKDIKQVSLFMEMLWKQIARKKNEDSLKLSEKNSGW